MAKVLHMPNTDFNYRALKKKWKVHGIWEMLHCRVGDVFICSETNIPKSGPYRGVACVDKGHVRKHAALPVQPGH